jgi:hypothetical protein
MGDYSMTDILLTKFQHRQYRERKYFSGEEVNWSHFDSSNLVQNEKKTSQNKSLKDLKALKNVT